MEKTLTKRKPKKKLPGGKALYMAMKKLQFDGGVKDVVAFIKKWR